MPTLEEKNNDDSALYDQIVNIPEETLRDIDSFKNRYLGSVLKKVYATHPELQDEIDTELKNTIKKQRTR